MIKYLEKEKAEVLASTLVSQYETSLSKLKLAPDELIFILNPTFEDIKRVEKKESSKKDVPNQDLQQPEPNKAPETPDQKQRSRAPSMNPSPSSTHSSQSPSSLLQSMPSTSAETLKGIPAISSSPPYNQWITDAKTSPYVKFTESFYHLLHSQLQVIASSYAEFKIETDPDKKRSLFRSVFGGCSGVLEDTGVSCTKDDQPKLALLLNLFLGQNYFDWLEFPRKSQLKALRNIYSHNSFVMRGMHLKDYITRLPPASLPALLHRHFSYHQLQQLEKKINQFDEVLFFDRETNGDHITALLVEKPEDFLAKIITILHFISFLTGNRGKLIFSKRVAVIMTEKTGLPLGDEWLLEMLVLDHVKEIQEQMKKNVQDTPMFD
jgi:hypothetical protein